MGKRTKARECALQMLYQWDSTREPMDRVAGLFWQVRTTTDETRAMAERLARGAQREVEGLDAAITSVLTNWRFDRVAAVDRNILRIAAYELGHEPQTPSAVIIDEAVEMAKRFGEADSPAFVNGVLDAVRRALRKEEAQVRWTTRDDPDGNPAPATRGGVPMEGWPAESVDRLGKAERLRSLGIPPYPTRYERTHSLGQIVGAYHDKSLEELDALAVPVRIAGRVLTRRGHGKASFATLSDGESRLQVYLRQEDVGERAYAMFSDLVDQGDYIGVAGQVMRTRKGELSVQARDLTFLSKALLPPPEKWHGLADVEARYRQRYLDLMANPEVRQVFVRRSAMVAEIRRFMDGRGYVEVETPMMQVIPGGAVARPFVTHHNALDIDLYLRIAPELYLKRLVVGGLEKVYEINRNFRNEGVSSMHNPEFTMLEFYTACFDVEDTMDITEELIAAVAAKVAGDKPVTFRGREVWLQRPFARVTMKEAVRQAARTRGLSLEAAVLDDPARLLEWTEGSALRGQRNAKSVALEPERYRGLSHGKRVAQLFEDLAESGFWNPTFVTDYPVEVSPLSKARPDDPSTTERFELYVAGMEVANGFSELNDPLEQRARFLGQLEEREKGDLEAHPMDDDYIRALGHGLPPTGGCGVGIDRLAMVLTDSPSIRDVILFPHMRPEP